MMTLFEVIFTKSISIYLWEIKKNNDNLKSDCSKWISKFYD